MSRIESMMVQGWMPFAAQHHVELPAGPIAVVAQYRNNPRRSNWAGKTALIEAIGWALFGVHRKRLDDDVINSAADGCTVELKVGTLTVRRSRKRGASTVLQVWAGDTEAMRGNAAQQFLIQHLGMSWEDYVATVDFRQDDIESIVGMRTGKRREVIAAWLRMERWALAAKRVTERARAAQQKLVEVRAALGAVDQALLDDHQRVLMEAEWKKAAGERVRAHKEVSALSLEMEGTPDPAVLRNQFAEMAQLRVQLATLKPLLTGRAAAQYKAAAARERMAAARSTRDQKYAKLRDYGKVQAEGFDGTCPVTCQRCPVALQIGSDIDQITALHQQAEEEAAAAQAAYDAEFEATRPLDAVVRQLDQHAGTYNAAVHRAKELVSKIGTYTEADLDRLTQRDAELEAGLTVANERLQAALQEEARCKQVLESDRQQRERRAQYADQLIAAEREARVVALMAKALGPTGVPARIAKVHVTRLEGSANELLSDSGLSLEFGWERATKDLALTCGECGYPFVGQRDKKCPKCDTARGPKLSDELEILVDDQCGEVEDVKSKSGGARVLVASALRLAASAMLREIRGTPVAWATIDEPFGPLDAENREGLARVFGAMLGAVGLEQAFVVSHDQVLLDSLPHRLIIERGDTASTLRLERAA